MNQESSNKDIIHLVGGSIAIEVNKHGAEMVSLKKDGREYLWSGDAAFWNRHAPILFPVVGKPFNNELHVDGKVYPMKQHGFARDSEFEVIGEGRLRMVENDLSASYPYRIGLEVCYRLDGSDVEVVWTVENLDHRDAYFQIGAHPGFLLPDYEPEKMINGYVRFYSKEGKRINPALTSSLEDGNRIPKGPNNFLLHETLLMPDTFCHDALIIEQGQVGAVQLYDRHCKPVLAVHCSQAEAFGIWAPHKEGCPFVCIEPWCGICDEKGYVGDISSRQYIHRLAPKEKYSFTYTIELY
ncbi:MAG: aldose 1-epimerase family protein [Bacteroidales bacterium]|nr:aldose 1-epimerase family protein [Bacteroidales bacterium]